MTGLSAPPLFEYPLEFRRAIVARTLDLWKNSELPLNMIKFMSRIGLPISFERLHRIVIGLLIEAAFMDIINETVKEIENEENSLSEVEEGPQSPEA